MLKLTRLKIDKYRRVAPGTELVFDDGLNVLLGRNGTGKTTLLRLISMCLRSDFSELAQEELAIEYELRFQAIELLVRLENRRGEGRRNGAFPGASVEVRLDADMLRASFEYDVAIDVRLTEIAKVLRIRGSSSKAWAEYDGAPGVQQEIPVLGPNPFVEHAFGFVSEALGFSPPRFQENDEGALISLMVRLREANTSAYRFDESLAALKAVEGRSHEDSASRFPVSSVGLGWWTDQEDRKLAGLPMITFVRRFVPVAVEQALNAQVREPEDITGITLRREELPFLDAFIKIVGFQNAAMEVSLLKREVDNEVGRLHFGRFKFLIYFKDGSIITHDLLSYGQKRLLSFLYYVACNEGVVVADELVNGLHHEWIEACIDAIGQRQAFLTSQNPLLLDYLSFESAEQAARSFIVCRTESVEDRDRMRWANMSKDDAETFYRGYLAGIQHVSEVLRTEGLW